MALHSATLTAFPLRDTKSCPGTLVRMVVAATAPDACHCRRLTLAAGACDPVQPDTRGYYALCLLAFPAVLENVW